MNFLIKALMAASGDTSEGLSGVANGVNDLANELSGIFKNVMSIVMPVVFSVVLALGAFFSIKLGIAYAKTEKTEQREEAKKRLVGAIVGFGIGLVGAAVMWFLFTNDAVIRNLFKA